MLKNHNVHCWCEMKVEARVEMKVKRVLALGLRPLNLKPSEQ